MPQLLRDRLNAPSPSCGLWSQSGWSGPASFPQPRRPAGLSCLLSSWTEASSLSDHMQVFLFLVFCGSPWQCTLVPQGSRPLPIYAASQTPPLLTAGLLGEDHTHTHTATRHADCLSSSGVLSVPG